MNFFGHGGARIDGAVNTARLCGDILTGINGVKPSSLLIYFSEYAPCFFVGGKE